jgi:hypothetical protein
MSRRISREINSLKACLSKEVLEGFRTHKFLILAVGIMFFAFLDPIMLKLMPLILKSQMGDIDFSAMIDLSQQTAMANFSGDLFQLSTLIIVLTLMGIVTSEKSDKTLTIPVSMGCSINGILSSKVIVYGTYLTILSVLGMTTAYYYSGLIFGAGYAGYPAVLKAGVLYGIFFTFAVALLVLVSTFLKKGFVAGIVTLLIVYLIPVLQKFPWLGRYLPSHLLTEAGYFSILPSKDLSIALICTGSAIIILSILAVIRLEKAELV